MFELLFLFLFIILGLIVISFVRTVIVGSGAKRDETEIWVHHELNKRLSSGQYIIFSDLIIPSTSEKIRSTQIDHVIVSIYGIFCLETKSHQGSIYGGHKSKYWKQYLGGKSYDLYSPIRQNHHHVKSLEYLIRSRIKAPVHSYLVFPSAKKIMLNGNRVDFTLSATVERILNHTRQVYSFEDVTAISKGLAIVSSPSDLLREEHIESVKKYIENHR